MIAILSDFGNSEYIGVMKGVILSHGINLKIVDLCNTVSKQDVREGAWILYSTYRYFPKKTVFLCVVDPSVGTARQAISIETKNYYFVGPDNGLMWPAAEQDGILRVVALDVSMASATFHGRDVFAGAAAQLDRQGNISRLGKKTAIKSKIEFFLRDRVGEVVRIDNFGNLVTNLNHDGKAKYEANHGTKKLSLPFFRTYDEAPADTLFLIEGSAGTLEISEKNKRASELMKAKTGQRIEIR
jgi:hypothetical protein